MSAQNKFDETEFWNLIANQRVYAAFDDDEYNAIFDSCLGTDLKGKRIIDIGSASGVSAALLAARGAKVIGVDIAPDLIEQAKGLWKEYADRIDFMVGDAENLDVKTNSVDACFFGGVLHHIPDLDCVYSEVLRILKPGGKLIALEPNRLDWLELLEWGVADLRGKLSPNEYPIDPQAMALDLRQRGFADVRFSITRQDIPVLAQIPLVRTFFSRQKGFALKRPILRLINAFRAPEKRGTFFVLEATKL